MQEYLPPGPAIFSLKPIVNKVNREPLPKDWPHAPVHRQASTERACQSVSLVFGGMVRAGGVSGTGEDDLQVQDRSSPRGG